MASVSTDDRNVLFGLIALRAEVVTPEALAEAMAGWLKDDRTGIADRLIQQGALRPDRRAWVDAMVEVEMEIPERRASTLPQPSSAQASVAALTVPDQTDPTTPIDSSLDATMPFKPDMNPATVVHSDTRTQSTIIVAPSRFRILRSHARGGLGEVFVARDEELGREVALKEIQQRLAHDTRSRSRFLLEAEVTGGLEHPGVVPVYSLGHYPDGRPYYAMRFIKGKSLGDAIEDYHHAASLDPSSRPLLLRNLLRRFLDVCNAIDYAHSRGVLHRDLKPGNIMLGKYGETLVVDWGLAKAVGIREPSAEDPSAEGPLQPASGSGTAETMPGSAIGTPQFMSPEQAAGQVDKIGPASDVYSLGATLYCILTCHAAFEATDVRMVLHNVQRGEFPAPRSHEPKIPHRLQAICLKAMSLRPEDRYASAHALADDLEHWMADEPVSAYHEDFLAMLARWGRRHRTWVQAGAAALMAVAIVATFASVRVSNALSEESREKLKVEAKTNELLLNRAVEHFDRGRSGRGLLRLATGLDWMTKRQNASGPQGDTMTGNHAYRANLAAWSTQFHPLRQVFEAPDMVLAVAMSHDPKVAIIGGILPKKGADGGFVRVIDPTSGVSAGSEIRVKREVTALAFPPGDSQQFVVASLDGTVGLWRRDDKKLLLTFPHPAAVHALLIVDRGRSLLTACEDGTVRSWSMTTGREDGPRLKHPHPVLCLAANPASDAAVLTGCADGEIRVWDRNRGTERDGNVMKLRSEIVGLGVSRDGTVTAGARDGVIQTFRLSDGSSESSPIFLDTELSTLGLSPDGATVAVGCGDNMVRLYDRPTGAMLGLPLEHRGTVRSLVFSEHDSTFLTGCQDDAARVWEILPRDRLSNSRPIDPRAALGASSAGTGPIHTLQFVRDSKTLFVGAAHQAGLVESPGGGAVKGFPSVSIPESSSRAAISPGGDQIATVGAGPYLRLWTKANKGGRPRTIDLGGAIGTSVAYHPNEPLLAVGTLARGVRILDLATGAPRGGWLEHEGEVRTVAFSHDGTKLLGAGGDTVSIWDAKTGALQVTVNQAGPVYDAAFSPDDTWIVTGGENNTARLWDVQTGQDIGIPMICQGTVVSVAISSDGLTVMTGSKDHAVRLWDAATFQSIGPPYRLKSRVTRVAFSTGDLSFAAAGENGEIRVWNLLPPRTGSAERLVLWAKSVTGFTLDQAEEESIGTVRGMTATEYRDVKRALERSGPPIH